MGNLGLLLLGMGDYKGARSLFEMALEINREVLGKHHPTTVASMNKLALVLQATGDYKGARPLLEKALEINREVLGKRHPTTGLASGTSPGCCRRWVTTKHAASMSELKTPMRGRA